MSIFRSIFYSDSPNLDAFSRLRVSDPSIIFDSKLLQNNQPIFWDDQQTSGAGATSSYNTNQASVSLLVSNLTAGTRVRQTFRRFNYQSGRSQMIMMTGVFGSASTGITRRVGLFDSNNGLFYQQTSAGMSVVTRTFTSGVVVDNAVPQSNWELDKLDGTGPSGITLDFSKSQIMFFDFEWLGVGRVRFGWVVNGKVIYCHEFLNTNVLTLVYMATPNLPLRYEISNDGTGAASSLVQICSSIISEGGIQNNGFSFGMTRGTTAFTTLNDTGIYPLISFRLKSTHFGSTVRTESLSIACTSTAAYHWYLILNPTVTGTALVFSDVVNSSVEASTNTTNATKVTGGTILTSGVGQSTNEGGVNLSSPNDFALGSTIAGVSDILVLAIQRITGTTETFYGSLNIKDQQ